jgi:hypothetical protein
VRGWLADMPHRELARRLSGGLTYGEIPAAIKPAAHVAGKGWPEAIIGDLRFKKPGFRFCNIKRLREPTFSRKRLILQKRKPGFLKRKSPIIASGQPLPANF